MKLVELIDFEAEKKIDQMKQVAKQQAARVKSAQALLKLQKAKDKEQKARKRFVQSKQAAQGQTVSSISSYPFHVDKFTSNNLNSRAWASYEPA